MKVRLSESLIRIRVNLDDVSQWQQSGQVELSIPWIHHHCKIELSFTEAEHWQIPDIGTHIWCIQVPKPVFLEWVNTQQESIEYRNGSYWHNWHVLGLLQHLNRHRIILCISQQWRF